ncbi:unnamed protein product [Closterium sp. NIES-53]
MFNCTAALGAGEAAALGASEAAALGASASASSGADRTTLTPLGRPVAVSLADPSGGPVLAHFSTVLPCPAAPSGTLSGLYLPSFSTNLVSGADLQDGGVHQFTPASQRVTHCTEARTGRHLATFTRQPGSSLYTLTTASPPGTASGWVGASGQVFAAASRSGPESAPCSCRMAARLLVSGRPRSLPPLLPGPAPACVPCVEGRQRAAPHSSQFPPKEAPLQTLHMDVWGPARVRGQGHERYFLLVVDDYSRYTTVFPLRSKEEESSPLAFCEPTDRRTGMVMDVARTSMMHAAAPHFLWPFAVRYVAHQINLQPRVSLPETSPALLWTGKVGDASAFRVWGSRAFVRDLSADKLSPRASPCVFLGFPPDAPGWQFYHPTSRRVLSSQEVTFDETVPYYCLFPYRTTSLPPPPLFLVPGPPPVDPLPPQGPAPSGVSQVDAVEPVEVAGDSGAAEGAEPGGADSEGAEAEGTATCGVEPGGAEPGGAATRGAKPGGATPGGAEPGGATTGSAEPGGAEPGGAEPAGAVPTRVASGGTVPRGSPAGAAEGVGAETPTGGATGAAPSPYTGPTGGFAERCEPASRPALPVRAARTSGLGSRPCPPPVPGMHRMSLRPSTAPLRAPVLLLLSPLFLLLPTRSRTLFMLPSTAASALVAELVDFAARCRLDYAASLVAESESVCPPSVGGECALGMDVLEDRQEEVQCLAAASPHLVSVLLTPEGDLDALDIPTPRSYAEAIEGPYSSQWQAAMDTEMASWNSTGTYVDEVPPPGANIGSLHEEIWLRRPPGFTGSFPSGTQWSLRRPVYGLRQAPREWHDTLRTMLAALGFATSTADPSLFLCTDTSLPPFYILVYVDDLVFATADTAGLAYVKSELQKRHTSSADTVSGSAAACAPTSCRRLSTVMCLCRCPAVIFIVWVLGVRIRSHTAR